MSIRAASLGLAAFSLLWGGVPAAAQFDDPFFAQTRSWHITCYNGRGVLVINIPLAYGVTVDPNGMMIYYRNGPLSQDWRTVLKGADTNCDIGPNR